MTTRGKQPLFMAVMAAARGKKLTPADKLILAYLAYRQGRNGESWPGLRTISRDLGMHKATVLRGVEVLCNAGLLEKVSGSPGRGHSSRYSVRLDKRSTGATFSESGKGTLARPFDGEKRSHPATEKVHWRDLNHSRSIHKRYTEERALAPTDDAPGGTPAGPKTKTPRQPFIPPAVEQVQEYAEERGHPEFDAGHFVEHYTLAEWHDVGGNPVVSWKQKVLTWLHRDGERRKANGEPARDGYTEFGTHPATEEDIARLEKLGVFNP